MRWLALFLLGGLLVTSASPAQADGARGRHGRRPVVIVSPQVPVYGYPAYPAYPNRPAGYYGYGYPNTGVSIGLGNVQISVGTGGWGVYGNTGYPNNGGYYNGGYYNPNTGYYNNGGYYYPNGGGYSNNNGCRR